MNELEKIKEKIINRAKKDLESLKIQDIEIRDYAYKDFLESTASGKCKTCKSNLEIVFAEESENGYKYKFSCGHGSNGITIHETLSIKDSIKIRKNRIGVRRFIFESINGWFPSKRKDLSPRGVVKIRIVDRENNYYKEEIVDESTGRIIRFVEEKLSEHNKKSIEQQ